MHTLDHCRFCFLVAGHTKFAPDRLFALTGNAYNRADIFTAEELLEICQRFSTGCIEDGSHIFDWRSAMAKKYSDLPGVWKIHDFLIVRSINGQVVMKLRMSYALQQLTRVIIHDATAIISLIMLLKKA